MVQVPVTHMVWYMSVSSCFTYEFGLTKKSSKSAG